MEFWMALSCSFSIVSFLWVQKRHLKRPAKPNSIEPASWFGCTPKKWRILFFCSFFLVWAPCFGS